MHIRAYRSSLVLVFSPYGMQGFFFGSVLWMPSFFFFLFVLSFFLLVPSILFWLCAFLISMSHFV